MIARAPIRSPIRSPLAGSAPLSFPLLDNLVAYWNLSEASGQRNDSHTNGYHLTDINTVGSRTGIGGSGTAADLIAANLEYLQTQNAFWDITATDWSFSFWVLFDILSGNPGMVQRKGVSGVEQIRWDWNANNARIILFKASGNDQLTKALSSTGVWNFVQSYYNAATKEAGFALNNGAFSTVTMSAHPRSTGALPAIDFGRWSSNYMDGGQQYAGHWSRVLTASEWTALYNSGAGMSYANVSTYTG